MSEEEKRDILNEYRMHFDEGKHENKSEEDISKELGNPIEIAKELNAVYSIKKVEEQRSIKSMFTAVLSIIGLGVMNAIIIFMSFFGRKNSIFDKIVCIFAADYNSHPHV